MEAELFRLEPDGGAGGVVLVFVTVYGHVRGGIGSPVDGIEECDIVCVGDGVFAAVVIDVKGPEGFGMTEHR